MALPALAWVSCDAPSGWVCGASLPQCAEANKQLCGSSVRIGSTTSEQRRAAVVGSACIMRPADHSLATGAANGQMGEHIAPEQTLAPRARPMRLLSGDPPRDRALPMRSVPLKPTRKPEAPRKRIRSPRTLRPAVKPAIPREEPPLDRWRPRAVPGSRQPAWRMTLPAAARAGTWAGRVASLRRAARVESERRPER